MIYQRTKGLTGIEGITAIGWPMHGACRAHIDNFFTVFFSELVGHTNAPSYAAESAGWRTDHYPVRVNNLSDDWSYFMLYDVEYSVGDNSVGIIPAAIGANFNDKMLGVPLITPTGRSIRFCVAKVRDSHTLHVFEPYTDREKLIPYAFDIDDSKSMCAITMFGAPIYYLCDLQTMNDKSIPSRGSYITRILDYRANKCLIAIEPKNGAIQSYDFPMINTLGNPSEQLQYFRAQTSGRGADLGDDRYSGQTILAVIELELTGETVNDVTARVVYSPRDVEGIVSRSSPTETNIVQVGNTSKEVYAWSLIQVGAIIDAYYDPLGQVQARRYSVEHTFSGERFGRINDEYWLCNFDTESVMTLDGVTKQYRQIITHEVANPDGFDFIGPSSDHPEITVTNRIFVDHNLFSTDTITTVGRDLIIRPPEFSAISGNRAPYAGVEARCAQFGAGYAYASARDIYNPNTYTVMMRKNNSGTCVFYGVVENFWYWPDYPRTKQVSDTVVRSKAGNKTISAFIDIVDHNDPRYQFNYDNNFAVMRGYVGAKLRASVNLVTGAYYEENLDNPLYSINWR